MSKIDKRDKGGKPYTKQRYCYKCRAMHGDNTKVWDRHKQFLKE